MALEALSQDVLAAVSPEERERLVQSIAVGVLETGAVNARIVRSSYGNGVYAILVHVGLMLLLHKFFKYIHAGISPGEVTFCNRRPPRDLRRPDYLGYIHEVVENCNSRGGPYGPLVRLGGKAAEMHAYHLNVGEQFALAHEFGHFLNGDLEGDGSFRAIADMAGEPHAEEYVENKDHEKEFAADARAFEILARAQHCRGEDRLLLVPPLVCLFDLFYLLGGRDSKSHPHPLDRSIRLMERFFGSRRAQALKQSYNDPRHLFALLLP